MRTVSIRLEDLCRGEIGIGYVGENLHTRVIIDAAKMYSQYPSAAASLTVKPPFGEAYPAVVERQGDSVVWDVTDSDLIRQGNGEIQLAFTVDETVAKTYIGKIRIGRSIIPTGDIPDPLDDFLTRAGAAVTAIPETIDAALEEARESGEFDGPPGPAGSDGADGQDGVSPSVSVEAITGGHAVTITDASGDHEFNVMDGAKGDKGDKGDPGTTDYANLTNKPQVAGVTLTGNKSLDDLGAAAKADTVLSSTLSHGRKNNTTVGADSIAYGTYVTASGAQSQAFGSGTTASGTQSHAEGGGTTASGTSAHAEGSGTYAAGNYSHAEGGGTHADGEQSHAEGGGTTASGTDAHSEGGSTQATGDYSHAEGTGTIANHKAQHAGGEWNVADPSSAAATARGTYAEIIGNGTSYNARSNARTLDWSGNEELAGDLTVKKGSADEVSISTLKSALNAKYEKPSGGIPASDLASGVIPTVPVTDVQVNGTSVLSQGVANVPIATSSSVGVSKPGATMWVNSSGALGVNQSDASKNKAGTSTSFFITPSVQDSSVFYALAKLAGADMVSLSGETVGVYPEAQRVAIQKMLGIYEAPWELIREDTFTNATEANHEITVDGNGQPFELTSAILMFETPKQATASGKGNYGGLYLTDGANEIAVVYCNGWQQAENSAAHGCWLVADERDGLVFIYGKNNTTTTNMSYVQQNYKEGFDDSVAQAIKESTNFTVRGAKISSVTGTGHYKLYGKRKWN